MYTAQRNIWSYSTFSCLNMTNLWLMLRENIVYMIYHIWCIRSVNCPFSSYSFCYFWIPWTQLNTIISFFLFFVEWYIKSQNIFLRPPWFCFISCTNIMKEEIPSFPVRILQKARYPISCICLVKCGTCRWSAVY